MTVDQEEILQTDWTRFANASANDIIIIKIIIINALLCLPMGDLKAITESEIIAAQDKALQTIHQITKILQTETNIKCRLCQKYDEKIRRPHFISMPNIGKRTIHKEIGQSVFSTTLYRMQGNKGKIQ